MAKIYCLQELQILIYNQYGNCWLALDGNELSYMAGSSLLLLNFNGTNNSTTFIEETGKSIAANSDVKLSTDQSVFGNSAAYFDGTDDCLSF